jgi:hypothetical protein
MCAGRDDRISPMICYMEAQNCPKNFLKPVIDTAYENEDVRKSLPLSI